MLSDRAKISRWRNAILNHIDDYAVDHNMTPDEALQIAASALFKSAVSGEAWALKELGDRVDGKAPQSVDLTVSDKGTDPKDYSRDELLAIIAGGGSRGTPPAE